MNNNEELRYEDVLASRLKPKTNTPNPYKKSYKGVQMDVYDVLKMFEVSNPATQHAIKKLLMNGNRGHKGIRQDLHEAISSIYRAIELEENA